MYDRYTATTTMRIVIVPTRIGLSNTSRNACRRPPFEQVLDEALHGLRRRLAVAGLTGGRARRGCRLGGGRLGWCGRRGGRGSLRALLALLALRRAARARCRGPGARGATRRGRSAGGVRPRAPGPISGCLRLHRLVGRLRSVMRAAPSDGRRREHPARAVVGADEEDRQQVRVRVKPGERGRDVVGHREEVLDEPVLLKVRRQLREQLRARQRVLRVLEDRRHERRHIPERRRPDLQGRRQSRESRLGGSRNGTRSCWSRLRDGAAAPSCWTSGVPSLATMSSCASAG